MFFVLYYALTFIWVITTSDAIISRVTRKLVTEKNPETRVSPHVTRGMVIDGGSGGSRLHVFRWEPRIFKQIPPAITVPTSDEKWTQRIGPGIADLSGSIDLIQDHLVKLLNFAKNTLVGLESEFSTYPIFFKATGGMRELPVGVREVVMSQVRLVLSNKTICPFYFTNDMARVISGEEEAIYSWAAVNFLLGNLIPQSIGSGTASTQSNSTYGTIDLGGASSQIAFFVPSQDVSEGLFKLQLGGQKHWNVYTKSFLQFGHVSARLRHVTGIANDAMLGIDPNSADVPKALNYCFVAGYSEHVSPGPGYDNGYYNAQVLISGPPVPAQDQFKRCLEAVQPLLVKYNNDYCNIVYDGQCSINGAYQPSVRDHQQFIGTSSYRLPWKILLLPDTASLTEYLKRSEYLCALSFRDTLRYYEVNNLNLVDDKLADLIPNYCFLVAYTYALLTIGYGFQENQSLTVLDQVRGNKVGWPLGAILYEINTLPWELESSGMVTEFQLLTSVVIAIFVGLLIGSAWTLWVISGHPSSPLYHELEHDDSHNHDHGNEQYRKEECYRQYHATTIPTRDADRSSYSTGGSTVVIVQDRNQATRFGRQENMVKENIDSESLSPSTPFFSTNGHDKHKTSYSAI